MPVLNIGAKCDKCDKYYDDGEKGVYRCPKCRIILCNTCRKSGISVMGYCPDCPSGTVLTPFLGK